MSSSSTDFAGQPEGNRLEQLLKFMSKEVDIKQRNELTASFTNNLMNATTDGGNQGNPSKQQERSKVVRKPVTIMGFHVANAQACVFCGLYNHKADGCRKTQTMTYEEKMGILRSKGRRFICTLPHRWCCACRCCEHCSCCWLCAARLFSVNVRFAFELIFSDAMCLPLLLVRFCAVSLLNVAK